MPIDKPLPAYSVNIEINIKKKAWIQSFDTSSFIKSKW